MPEAPPSATPERGGTDAPPASRWPRVLGTLGLAVGVLMVIDQLGDLLFLPLLHSDAWWRGLVEERLAHQIADWLPPTAWWVTSRIAGLLLGALLLAAAWRLRRRRRSGASWCNAWAWLALAWLAVEAGLSLSWLYRHLDELLELAPGTPAGTTVVATLSAYGALAIFPVCLLLWLSREESRRQIAGWPA